MKDDARRLIRRATGAKRRHLARWKPIRGGHTHKSRLRRFACDTCLRTSSFAFNQPVFQTFLKFEKLPQRGKKTFLTRIICAALPHKLCAQSRCKFLSEKQLLFRQFNAAAQTANCAAAPFYGIRSAKNSVWNLRLPGAALVMRLDGNPASEKTCAKARPYGISQPRRGFARQAAGPSVRSRYSSSAVRCA